MGDWTNIKGQAKSPKLSIKKIVKNILDGEDWVGDFKEDNQFEVSFERVGFDAIKYITEIGEAVSSRDPNCNFWIDISTTFNRSDFKNKKT